MDALGSASLSAEPGGSVHASAVLSVRRDPEGDQGRRDCYWKEHGVHVCRIHQFVSRGAVRQAARVRATVYGKEMILISNLGKKFQKLTVPYREYIRKSEWLSILV